MCRQVRWSEFLCQFNLIIWSHPRHLSTKPNALTRQWDVYPKEGGSNYASINSTNLWPVFMQEQLASSLRVTFLSIPVLHTMIIMDTEKLHSDIQSSLQSDPIASIQLNSPSPRWSVDSEGFLLFDEKIYISDHSDLQLHVLQYKHDHPISRHFRQNQTLELVWRQYVWLKLQDSIKSYVKSCTTCMCSKSQRHRPYGLLKQLLIPERPWNSISMDFIEKLPMSDSSNTILVIVDLLTKQSIFILTVDTITSPMLAKLFILHVFSKHGIPLHVTSSRGLEFVSAFFCSLGKVLDMKLHFTSSYHPEGNRQTERANQTLEQYLQVYCNYQQNNWSDLLPLAEFTYNNAPNTMTGLTLFYANKGYHPSITVHPERDIAVMNLF